MKTRFLLPLATLLTGLLFSSCATYGPHGNQGTVVGRLLGAGAGALLGEHKGRELEGAAIGGALGALAGGALGTSRDQSSYRSYHPQSTYVAPQTTYVAPRSTYYAPSPVVHRSYYPRTSHISIGTGLGYGYGRSYCRSYGRSHSRCYTPPSHCY